jgi:hypothetical protein
MPTPIVVLASHKITLKHPNWHIIPKPKYESPTINRIPSLKHKMENDNSKP